ncbi:MAG: trigger factor [Verrucomicrobiota bacterium]
MDLDIKEVNETRREVSVTFSPDEVTKEEKTILIEFGRQAKIPGFRPGKAPEALLRKRYGREIKEELKRKVVQTGYQRLEKESDLKILNVVSVDDPDLEASGTPVLTLTIDIKPSYEIPEYKGIELEREPSTVTDEEVEEAIEATRAQRADFTKVDRPAEAGDYVRCSYEGKYDGNPIAEEVSDRPIYGTQKNTWEEAGSSDETPGVSEIAQALVGMKDGETKDVEAAFGDDHEVEFLRGKKIVYSLEVLEVRERKLPELDEDFFKSLNVESLEKLQEQTAESLKNQKEQTAQNQLRQTVTQKLGDMVTFSAPESLIENETNQILSNYMGRQMQQGASQEDFEQNREALFASASEEALKKVRLDLLLDDIAEKEDVEVTEEDMSNFLYSYAMQTRRAPDDIVKELQKDRSRVLDIQRSIRRSKAVGKVIDYAEITESEPNS